VITVTPTYQRKIYDVDASVPITLFTNNLSSVALNGTTNIEWVTRINYTVTNALSTVWESRIEWINGTPDLTVTGRYEFAFSTSDGVKIQGRQVYPTVYNWTDVEGRLLSASVATSPNGTTLISGANGTNGIDCAKTSYSSGDMFRFWFRGDSITNCTLQYYCYIIHIGAYFGNTIEQSSVKSEISYGANTGYIQIASILPETDITTIPSDRRGAYFSYRVGVRVIKTGGANLQYQNSYHRKMNELETSAYNAGWRP
jgi:hypothetical protein